MPLWLARVILVAPLLAMIAVASFRAVSDEIDWDDLPTKNKLAKWLGFAAVLLTIIAVGGLAIVAFVVAVVTVWQAQ